MRRRVLSVSLFVFALSGGAASGAWPQAQELALRGPRFVAAWKSSMEAVDVSNAVVLRRRVSLDLTNVTADEALKEITRQADLEISYSTALLPSSKSVSLHAREITVAAALTEVLLDAGVDVMVAQGGHMALTRRLAPVASVEVPTIDSGVVSGRVTDKATGAPLAGATVVVDGTPHSATTEYDGRYRIAAVASGTYRARARYIGYVSSATSITVSAGAETATDFALTKSVQELEQVIVTGTLIPTEVRAVPSPITVVTAEDIESQQLRRTDQIFRTSVPGSFSWEQGASDYTNSISVRGATSIFNQNYIKTIVDGIEVANDLYSIIDVNSIERVEILRGPEASTLHGSGASGGVMQIFTKKGDFGLRRPRIAITAAGTAVQSPYNSAIRQDYDLAVGGGMENVSYHLGGGYEHTGAWVPEFRSGGPSLFAGARVLHGQLTVDLSARYTSRTIGDAWDQNLRSAGYSPWQTPPFRDTDTRNQTYGVSLAYRATPWWLHNVTVGYDRLGFEYYDTRPRSTDGLYTVFVSSQGKGSVRYNTSARFALASSAAATVTAGVEHYQLSFGGFIAPGAQANSGEGVIFSDPTTPPALTRGTSENTGYFGQAQVAISDALFITAGLRAENNNTFGNDFGTAVAPRFGASLVQNIGATALKLRASYGEGLRPPPFGVSRDSPGLLANPNLGPEEQVGGEVGFDLYFGSHSSVSATYYNQTARGLIDLVIIDPSASPALYQHQNVGRVKNRGLEIEGRLAAGSLNLYAQYSRTNSSVRELGPSYSGDLQVGDQLLAIPKHTAGVTATLAVSRQTNLSAGLVYLGKWTNTDWIALLGAFFGGEPYRGSGRAYWIAYPAVAKANFSLQHQFSEQLSVFASIENLTNNRRVEQSNIYLIPGRQTTIGMRVTH